MLACTERDLTKFKRNGWHATGSHGAVITWRRNAQHANLGFVQNLLADDNLHMLKRCPGWVRLRQ